MAIRFACRCGKKLKATDDKIGKKVLCPSCGNPVTVPEEDTVAVDELPTGTSAANLAGDLLKRSAKKKSDPYADIGEEPGLGYDILEIAKLALKQALPALAGLVVLCIVVYWLASAVMTTDPELPELGRVYGVVTLDGQPIEGAMVTFLPKSKTDSKNPEIRLSPSIARTDASGEYDLVYTRDVKGAAVGFHSVMVQLSKAGVEQIDPSYNSQTGLVYEVKPGKNTIDLPVKSGSSK